MVDLFLFIIVITQTITIIWLLYDSRKERKSLLDTHTQDRNKLINALIARKPEELRDLTLADKVAPITPSPQQQSDLIPMDQLSDEDFEAHIKAQLENSEEA